MDDKKVKIKEEVLKTPTLEQVGEPTENVGFEELVATEVLPE